MKTVVIGLLGTTLDAPRKRENRWDSWRPSIDLCRHGDLVVDRFELLYERRYQVLIDQVVADLRAVSPETKVVPRAIELKDPWDFEEVYGVLHDFARGYTFKRDDEQYLAHITTGTHVAQICMFLLTESRHIPARLVQTSPPKRPGDPGSYSLIDLDLSKYDRIASRSRLEQQQSRDYLKSGIATRNPKFNRAIERIEQVAIASTAPVLLMGPTGAGKSQLARRIYELKHRQHQVEGAFVEINCATIRGDGAMSALFGHEKGSFTGAASARGGLLRQASGGVLFLDEIGELGADEQAMLLRAIETGRFLPVGADREVESHLQLISGTNCDLHESVGQGQFREDLLARINLWTFDLPPLRERREDLEPNLDYELQRWAERSGKQVTFNKEARKRFVEFATSEAALWLANFRDFSAAVERMATLADGGRISVPVVNDEIERLQRQWRRPGAEGKAGDDAGVLGAVLDAQSIARLDRFDRVQLADVVRVCLQVHTLSEAGRVLFAHSRTKRATTNDADRLRKYLARFNLDWDTLRKHS